MFRDGDLVVCKGTLGNLIVGKYKYRGPEYQTCEVWTSNCSCTLQYPQDLREYDEYKFRITEK